MKVLIAGAVFASATILFMACGGSDAEPEPIVVYTTSTFAGSSSGYLDDTGTAAQFYGPAGIARDNAGNLFVCDRDNNRIRKITPAGVVTTFAGDGTAGLTNATGTSARFNQPYGLCIDGSGNLYVADRLNYVVRKITPAGVVTTLAGSTQGFTDGTGAAAKFDELYGIGCDASGNVFVPDFFNNRIRKITPAGVVTTLAGNGTEGLDNGTGTAATFDHPFGLAVDGSGNILVSDYYNYVIRKVTPAGKVTTLAGSGNPAFTDGKGSAAAFNRPGGSIVDTDGNLYVCDVGNNAIRKVTPSGRVTTVSGAGEGNIGSTDGTTEARFDSPLAVAIDVANNTLYVADFGNNRIRKITF